MHTRFAKMDPTAEAWGCMSTLIMRWGPLPFWPPRSLSSCVQTGKSSLTSGMGPLSLCFSRAQLLPLALTLECLGEGKACILLHLTNARGLARGPLAPASASGPSCFLCCRLLRLTLLLLPPHSSLLTFACLRALDKLGLEIPSPLCGTEASSLKMESPKGIWKQWSLCVYTLNISESVLLNL